MHSANEALEVHSLANEAWLLFIGRAWLEDQKWSLGDAIDKARSTIRRLRDGTIKLEEEINEADPFFASDKSRAVDQTRILYGDTCDKFRSRVLQSVKGRKTFHA